MIIIKKIGTLNELDELLPLIEEFHNQNEFYKLYPKTGFLNYLTSHFLMPYMGVWSIKEDDKAIGYAIVAIEIMYLEKVCTIIDAYMVKVDKDASMAGFQEIEDWAKEQGCKYMTCLSVKDKGLMEKYGFEYISTYLVKRLEV